MLSAVILCCVLLPVLAEEYCYSLDTAPYNLFASKTVYQLVSNRKGRIATVPNCDPVLVWGLLRHGTRYPHRDQIKQQRDLENLRDNVLQNHNLAPHSGELCYGDVELLRDWHYNVSEADADLLSSSGVSEMYLLGKRLKTDFAPLDSVYTQDRFKIRFTEKVRTKQSAEAFTMGMFGSKIYLPDEYDDTTLLEPNHNCSGWDVSTNSEGAEKQTKSFREGPLIKDMLASVSRRLGFRYQLNFDVIKDIYNMCRFDKAWQPKSQHSPWCSAFTQEHLQLLEYDEDLNYYYRSGYGNPFTSMLGCPLVADLINTLHRRTQGGEEGPSGVFYFTSSLMLRAVQVRLGMASDPRPITSDSFPSADKRQWRSSFLTPFAGNLLAVLYRCGEEFKVMFYMNEQYVDYRGCDVGLCNWTYIHERFSPIIEPSQCNLNFCKTSSATTIGGLGLLLVLGVALSRLH